MNGMKFNLKAIVSFLLGITIAISVSLLHGTISIAQGQTTYWLGVKDGQELRFTVQVPSDAAKVILHKNPPPNHGDDTKPRYRTFAHTIDGKNMKCGMSVFKLWLDPDED